jgi:hypothetical protein
MGWDGMGLEACILLISSIRWTHVRRKVLLHLQCDSVIASIWIQLHSSNTVRRYRLFWQTLTYLANQNLNVYSTV